jgi:hypothetical protein
MDFAYLLIIDAIALIIATAILTYFIIRDIIRKKKKLKHNSNKPVE